MFRFPKTPIEMNLNKKEWANNDLKKNEEKEANDKALNQMFYCLLTIIIVLIIGIILEFIRLYI